jgi:type III secretion protein R
MVATGSLSQIPALAVTLGVLGLAPFIAVMVTSFIKLVVVLSLVRNALGIQQIPPNLVLNGLALILTLYVMAPVGRDMSAIMQREKVDFNRVESLTRSFGKVVQPLRKFLAARADAREKAFFLHSAHSIWPADMADSATDQDLLILIPSFTVSELSSAFTIGFFIYLPFIAIDLIVSNVLLAMGMMMVSPMTISLPIKLLLFVLINGWGRLVHSLVLTYR